MNINHNGRTYNGTWATNSGNTYSDVAYTAKTIKGLLRILGKIIDGNITRYGETGKASIWGSQDNWQAPTTEYYRTKGRWTKSTESRY